MSVNEKMTAIANEIRELSGTENLLGLDAMTENVQEANEEIALQKELLEQAIEELKGKADPELYNKGHADGYADGYAESVAEYEPFVDSLIENTLVSLVNDRVKKVNAYLCNRNANLVEVKLPNVETIGDRAFTGCDGLTEIDFPKCTYIGTYGFQSCQKLATINLPELKTVGGYAFQSCSSLTSVVMPKLEKLGTADFYSCWRMHTFDLPVCASISSNSIIYCSALTKLILRSPTLCTLGGNGLANTPIAKGTGYVYVPDNLVEEYKAATNWANYASQIKPISELEG